MISKCLYVDLSNVFGGMCELLPPDMYLDFSSLLPLLNTLFGGIDVVKVYGAYMPVTPKDSLRHYRLVRRQRLFFDSARQPPVIFTSGYISKHGQEKGIDMQLGVDMVHDAHQNRFSDIILWTGDADFEYPIEIIRQLGKNFHYLSLASRFSTRFSFLAWRKVVLDYDNQFIAGRRLPRKLQVIDMKLQPKLSFQKVP